MFLEKKKIEMATAEQTEGVDKEKLEALSGTIGNLGVETEYLKKRLIAEQEIVTTDIQSEERIPDWQERLDQKEQEVMSAMREQIIEEGTITRDQQEPYESSKIRTTQMLLKLKELITAQETQPSEQRSEQPEEPVEINETENSPQASEKNTNSHVLANIATQGREI